MQGVVPPWRDRAVHRAQGEPLSQHSAGLPQSTGDRSPGGFRPGGRARLKDGRPGLQVELGAEHLGAHQQEGGRQAGEPSDAPGLRPR